MALHLYNTYAREKQAFRPIDPDHVRMYVCGPTVYNHPHIGNARPAIVFDVLFRLLQHDYKRVTYVRNITDVDDKINKAAREQGVDISVITKKFSAVYHDDMGALGVLDPTIEPRVTDHLPQIVRMIEELVAKGHAYEAEGHVLFSVKTFDQYGSLSRRNQDELLAGARVEVAPYKRDAGDFVLWKPSAEDQPGWESPWGRGRPGWHIECSCMSAVHLGETIDIHGGGQDLIFPHHENELAQSMCAHAGKVYANYWVHNGFLNVDHEKMSKSLGNVLLVRDLLEQAPGEAVRFAIISAHYRHPLDWVGETLPRAKKELDKFYLALERVADIDVGDGPYDPPPGLVEALEDDLNTPLAIGALHQAATALNKAETPEAQAQAKGTLLAGGKLLGLFAQDPREWFAWKAEGSLDEAEIDRLIQERQDARAHRDFARADAIRDDLAARGIIIEDRPDGVRWRYSGS